VVLVDTLKMTRVGRLLLLLLAASTLAYGGWLYRVYFKQLNNSIALQRCALELETRREQGSTAPDGVQCRDEWGGLVGFYRHGETYVLVSGGRDREEDIDYDQLAPSTIAPRSTCLDSTRDTVFVGRRAVQHCSK